MKKHLYKKAINIPIYRGKFVIVITNSVKRIQKHISNFWEDGETKDLYAHSFYGSYQGTQGFYMILNFDNSYRKIYHGVIAHEAIHLAQRIVTMRGVKLDVENDEPVAYLVEWITDETYKFIKQNKFKVHFQN